MATSKTTIPHANFAKVKWRGEKPQACTLAYSKAELEEIFAASAFSGRNPRRTGACESVHARCGVALSAQATDVGVNRATRTLFKIADTPQKMLDLGEEGLIQHIKTIGLYRNKAKNVIALSRLLLDEFGGEVPKTAKS